MPFRTLALALAAASLAAAAQAQTTTSPANTASSNGKDASTVTSTPPQDPTLGSGQQSGSGPMSTPAKHKAMRKHPRSTMGGGSSSPNAPGGPGSPPPVLPNSTGSMNGSSPGV